MSNIRVKAILEQMRDYPVDGLLKTRILVEEALQELTIEPQRVHVLSISHRHGVNLSVHETEEGMRTALAEYCREWWSERCDGEPPADDQTLIDEYFNFDHDESYEMSDEEIRP